MPDNWFGIIGGTFDPLHCGHLELATEAKERFQLKKVIFLLSARPPHKLKRKMLSAQRRAEILEIALRDHPHFLVSLIEMEIEGPSFTCFSLQRLKKDFPGVRFFFLLGGESFLQIRTWKNYQQLLEELSFLVVIRPAVSVEKIRRMLAELNHQEIKKLEEFQSRNGVALFSYPGKFLDLSSTLIRRMLRAGIDCQQFVPANIYEIIKEEYQH